MTQPALSRAIRTLEETLGERLFERTTRTVMLTAAGEILLPVALRLIRDYDDAFAGLDEMLAGTTGEVVLGALPSFAGTALPAILRQFHKINPDVHVSIKDEISGTIYEQLRERKIDIAVTIKSPETSDIFTFEPLFDDPCLAVCRKGDVLLEQKPVTWPDLAARPFIAMIEDSSVRQLTDRGFKTHGLTVQPLFGCRQLATLGALIEAGHGVSALPASTLQLLAGFDLVAAPIEDPQIVRVVGLTHLSRRFLTPAARTLAQFIRSELSKPPYI